MNKNEIKEIIKESKKLAKEKTEEELFALLGETLVANKVLEKENLELHCSNWVLKQKIDKPYLFKETDV